jgi:hypothetical protein
MGFVCENLNLTQAGAVFPLVREAVPGLTLKAWNSFARLQANPRRAGVAGIMVIRRRARAHPCGLFVYHREHDLSHGPILLAEHVVAVDVLDSRPVMQALLHEMEALAERLGCTAIRTVLLGSELLVADRLAEAGHAPEGETLWKQLPRRGTDACSDACA